ncbi:MAG TPA: CHRD domain-containing protein [Nitrososphaeraceae archaeon]|nr:CHRD domain-containing protein [Nitrososphaeraceae archaeon]
MFLHTILMLSIILTGLIFYLTNQSADAYDNYEINFEASLDPYQISSYEDTDYDWDSRGIAYLSFDTYLGELYYEVFLEGMSYVEGDDVEIIQIHAGRDNQEGPTVLSLCDEKKGKGHCREGPGLSVEGILEEKDLKGPLKGASFDKLIELIESGESYVYVQSRDHPEGEIRGQIGSINLR